ncbi:MAG: hypothetical protein WA125_03880 [Desulfosporosinus sp.]
MKDGFKPSLATTLAKASRRVITTLWAGQRVEAVHGATMDRNPL